MPLNQTKHNFQTYLFDILMEPKRVLPLRARVDLEVMAMIEYSTFPSSPEYELYH